MEDGRRRGERVGNTLPRNAVNRSRDGRRQPRRSHRQIGFMRGLEANATCLLL